MNNVYNEALKAGKAKEIILLYFTMMTTTARSGYWSIEQNLSTPSPQIYNILNAGFLLCLFFLFVCLFVLFCFCFPSLFSFFFSAYSNSICQTTGILDSNPYSHILEMGLNRLGKTLISMSLLLNYHPKPLQDHQA